MTSYEEDLLRSLAKLSNLASMKFLSLSIPLMTAYCDAPGEVNSGDVWVFRGDYHVVYILVKNDYIDNKISYRLLRGWISTATSKIGSQKKIAFNLNNHKMRKWQCQRLVVRYAWLRETVLNPLSSLVVQAILAMEHLFLLFPQSATRSWSPDLLSLL